MKINGFLILLFFAITTAYGQMQERVAILNTVDDRDSIDTSDLIYLTNRLRETAVKVLPKSRFGVMTTESIVAFLGSQENARKVCNESSCLAEVGRKVSADHVAQARVGRFGNQLSINFQLYNVKTGNLVDSFTGNSKDIFGLLAIIDEKAPDLFKQMLGVSGGSKAPLVSVDGGISGVQTAGEDYEFAGKKHYLANISSDPEGASLSFNGVPAARCTKTPCNVELGEGSVRIIAALEQYEMADTTVSIKQNNQSVRIRMKANFGVLEIKPAYSDGIGKDERWNLTINGNAANSWENRLSPNKYKVELNHRCYEAVSFEAGINRDKREVFDMASHIRLKKGGLDLSAEVDDEPVSEPVFVNGAQVGETPFSGSVPVCAKIEIGNSREEVNVKIKHNESVKYTHKMNTEERKRRLAAEQQARQEAARRQQEEFELEQKIERFKRTIRLGARWRGGSIMQGDKGSGSELFDKSYAQYDEKIRKWEKEFRPFGALGDAWYLNPGLTLNIRITDVINLATELSYDFIYYNISWGSWIGNRSGHFADVSIFYQTIEVPVLLKLVKSDEGKAKGKEAYVEAGFQWGFPVNSKATVSSGSGFPDSPFKYEYSDFRVKTDYGLVFGFGMRTFDFSWGMRLTYPLTKLDRYGTINAPSILSLFTLVYDFF